MFSTNSVLHDALAQIVLNRPYLQHVMGSDDGGKGSNRDGEYSPRSDMMVMTVKGTHSLPENN